MAQQDDAASAERLHPFRVLPGGRQPVPEEWVAAAIMGGALLFLWIARRNLGEDSAHVHVGGTAALVFTAYYLIVTGLLRLAAARLADRGDTPIARGFAFFAA